VAISGAKGSRPNSLSNTIILRTNLWCRYRAHEILWINEVLVCFFPCYLLFTSDY